MFRASLVHNIPSSPGSLKLQYNCCAITSTGTTLSGGLTYSSHTTNPGAKRAITPIVVSTVSVHSVFLFSG